MSDNPNRVDPDEDSRRWLPWRRSNGIAAALILAAAGIAIGLPVLLFGSIIGWMTLTACRGEERATYEEFAQYSPRAPKELDPRPGRGYVFALGGNCHVVFDTTSTREEITDYYTENLRERGWKVEIGEPRSSSETTGTRRLEITEDVGGYSTTRISATRGMYHYLIYISPDSSVESPPGKLHVTVTVRDR